ncbi:MAG: phage tail protein [Chloroflexi bacterium]|nr:phage tail protein [Anaerolineaceae bacterium]NMB88209.1 phage tail protein [Chloroflexota bacterium]
MSLLHGPKKPPSPNAPGLTDGLLDKAVGAVGVSAIRMAERLLGIRFDPAPAYLFYVSISGVPVALFTACEGLQVKREVEEVHEGGLNDQVHVLPGTVSAGRITLRRGLTVSRELWDWFAEGLYDCKVKRVNMSVTQGGPGMSALGAAGKGGPGVVKSWNIEGAYPVSWSLSSLDVNNTTQAAIESVEIACKSLSLSRVVGTPMSPSALLNYV